QILDLEADERHGLSANAGERKSREEISRIHELKTAALISAACQLGALAARAEPLEMDALREFGKLLGLAFQAVDDLLDVSGTAAKLGKTAGKDAASGKQTLASVVGMEEGFKQAEKLAEQAGDALVRFGARARPLIELARFVVERNY